MTSIGKILPKEGYIVIVNGDLSSDHAVSLTHLYQPLIGPEAIMLYQTLLHDDMFQTDNPQTHHTLMNYMDRSLGSIYQMRRKLEGIGLLQTFEMEPDDQKIHRYELQVPFVPAEFFADGMLSQLLYHHIGYHKFMNLKNRYTMEARSEKWENVTSSFHDVFQTKSSNLNKQPPMEHFRTEDVRNEPDMPSTEMDFTWIEQMLGRQMIPARKVLTGVNKRLIEQMMDLYGLPLHEVEKAILWALDEENTLNREEFRTACQDLFQMKTNQAPIHLQTKSAPETGEKEVSEPETREELLIYHLERKSPKDVLEDFSSGHNASIQDLKMIDEVMSAQGLPKPVMNVLIHYVLLQSDMKLSKAYMEKIASHWSRAQLKTAKEALAFARKQTVEAQKPRKKRNYQKPISREVVPDWFREQEKQKETGKQQTAKGNEDDDAGKVEEVQRLLDEFIHNQKSNQG